MQVKLRNPERVVEVKGPKTVGAVLEELEDEGFALTRKAERARSRPTLRGKSGD
jgi:hypothetical protein